MQKVAFITIFTILISGCSILKRESKISPETEYSLEISKKSIIEKNLTEGNFNIQKAEIQYIEDGTTINLIASLKYRLDRKYLISLRSRSGIEIARISISKDTILVNDRINKKLYYGSSDYLQKKYGISTDALPLLLGDLVLDNGKEIIIECNNGRGEIKGNLNSRNINYKADCTKKKATNIIIENYTGESRIEIKLENFQNSDGKIFPETIEIVDPDNKSKIVIRIKKIVFNSNEEIKFVPGADYEKIKIK